VTPTAITPAGRGTRKKPAAASKRPSPQQPAPGPRAAGHRSELRRPPAPRAPRRVSGPLGGVTQGRPLVRPQSPAVRPRTRSAAPRAATERTSLPARWAAVIRGLPDHPLLDRIIRGRAWIPLLGVLLAGIVAMQVEVLKLNNSIGSSLERGTALQSRNELLRASYTSLADDQRIESLAARMGMVMPAPAAIKFLSLGQPGDIQRAVANVHQPDATSFAAQLALTDSASAPQAVATTTIVPTTSPTSTGVTDSTAPSSATGATGATGATDTTSSPPPTATPPQTAPAGTPPTAPAGTTTPSASPTGSATPTQTTPAVAPTQPTQGASTPSGSGGGVAPSSGGVTATSTGT
jgi:hypothetical protein